jgi:uncharacterized protein (DUF1015 family)
MTEFDNLKKSYTNTIQFGLVANVGYQQVKQGNDNLHELCKNLVENSNYDDMEKMRMKQELELLKESLSNEIERYYLPNNS